MDDCHDVLARTFGRYTSAARVVLLVALDEAQAIGHATVDTGHLLLGIAADRGLPGRALRALGVTEPALRIALSSPVCSAAPSPATATWRLARVLALASAQARTLGEGQIAPEHLLLGLAAEGRGRGIRALASLGASAATVRATLLELLRGREWSPVAPTIKQTNHDVK